MTQISLEGVLVAAELGRAPVAAESAGYLALAVADQLVRAPLAVDAASVHVSPEGTVSVDGASPASAIDAERTVRALLGSLLAVAPSSTPALGAAARRASGAGVAALVAELEGALIPVNRSAARRAIGRLARETVRARDAGELKRRAPKPSRGVARPPARREAPPVAPLITCNVEPVVPSALVAPPAAAPIVAPVAVVAPVAEAPVVAAAVEAAPAAAHGHDDGFEVEVEISHEPPPLVPDLFTPRPRVPDLLVPMAEASACPAEVSAIDGDFEDEPWASEHADATDVALAPVEEIEAAHADPAVVAPVVEAVAPVAEAAPPAPPAEVVSPPADADERRVEVADTTETSVSPASVEPSAPPPFCVDDAATSALPRAEVDAHTAPLPFGCPPVELPLRAGPLGIAALPPVPTAPAERSEDLPVAAPHAVAIAASEPVAEGREVAPEPTPFVDVVEGTPLLFSGVAPIGFLRVEPIAAADAPAPPPAPSPKVAPPRAAPDVVAALTAFVAAGPTPADLPRATTVPANAPPGAPWLATTKAASVDDLLAQFTASEAMDEREVRGILKRTAGLEPTPPPPSTLAADDEPPLAPGPRADARPDSALDAPSEPSHPAPPPLRPLGPPRAPKASMALLFVLLALGIAGILAVWVTHPGFFTGH